MFVLACDALLHRTTTAAVGCRVVHQQTVLPDAPWYCSYNSSRRVVVGGQGTAGWDVLHLCFAFECMYVQRVVSCMREIQRTIESSGMGCLQARQYLRRA